jgi:L-threonylcarbamoyladenylate synthase
MVLSRNDPHVREILRKTLKSGGVSIFPCDTIYGFVGRVPVTEARIRRIKGRDETDPFLMLIGSVQQAAVLAGGALDERVTALWPGPLTVVMRTVGGTAAVRLPDDPFLTEIIRELGGPIYSTSVNRSGSPPLYHISEIAETFGDEVDLLVDGGDCPAGRPSTILDITHASYRIVRQGDFQVPPELLRSQ